MDLNKTQRRFSVMGNNTFKIANKLMQNQRICRLLKYPTKDPFEKVDPITNKDKAIPKQLQQYGKELQFYFLTFLNTYLLTLPDFLFIYEL